MIATDVENDISFFKYLESEDFRELFETLVIILELTVQKWNRAQVCFYNSYILWSAL